MTRSNANRRPDSGPNRADFGPLTPKPHLAPKMTPKPPKNAVLVDLMARLSLTEGQAAAYFGVPVFTYRKWLNGERGLSAAVTRLIETMGLIEALAPGLHAALLPDAAPKRGRPKAKGAEAP